MFHGFYYYYNIETRLNNFGQSISLYVYGSPLFPIYKMNKSEWQKKKSENLLCWNEVRDEQRKKEEKNKNTEMFSLSE